jgi:hypothetical protein
MNFVTKIGISVAVQTDITGEVEAVPGQQQAFTVALSSNTATDDDDDEVEEDEEEEEEEALVEESEDDEETETSTRSTVSDRVAKIMSGSQFSQG